MFEADVLPNQGQLRQSRHCWTGAAEARSARSPQAPGRGAGVRPAATRRGRARASARTGEAGSAGIRPRRPPQDDRASGRRKKNCAMSSANDNARSHPCVRQQRSTKLLRMAALGEALPPKARAGLLLFLRRGMWGWARALATMSAARQPVRALGHRTGRSRKSTRAVIHILAAMAMSSH